MRPNFEVSASPLLLQTSSLHNYLITELFVQCSVQLIDDLHWLLFFFRPNSILYYDDILS